MREIDWLVSAKAFEMWDKHYPTQRNFDYNKREYDPRYLSIVADIEKQIGEGPHDLKERCIRVGDHVAVGVNRAGIAIGEVVEIVGKTAVKVKTTHRGDYNTPGKIWKYTDTKNMVIL